MYQYDLIFKKELSKRKITTNGHPYIDLTKDEIYLIKYHLRSPIDKILVPVSLRLIIDFIGNDINEIYFLINTKIKLRWTR